MGTGPEPVNPVGMGQAERPVVQPDADAVELAAPDGLELKGGM